MSRLYRKAHVGYIARMPLEDFLERIELTERDQAFPHDAIVNMEIPRGKLGGTSAFDREHWIKRGNRRCHVIEHVESVSSLGELAFTYPPDRPGWDYSYLLTRKAA